MPIGKRVAAELNTRKFAARNAVLLPFLYRFSYTSLMLERSRPRRIGFFLGLVAILTAVQARAADTGNGSKNFTAPRTVPNYFSNEAGPLQGPASEMRRGPLYTNQTYGASPAAAAVVVPRTRQHIAMAEPRGRLIHGRLAYKPRGRFAENRTVVHSRRVYRAAAHDRSRSRVEHVSARAHTIVHRTTRVSAHRGGRG